jgi:hypothetical protein
MKRVFLIVISMVMMLSFLGCDTQEKQVVSESPTPKGPIMDTSPGGAGHSADGPKTVFTVVVPPEVEEKWTAVVIVVEDKQTNTQEEFTTDIGSELAIPDSDLVVKVGPFLPDFKMSADTITSTTADPNNPAVGIAVLQNGNKIFPPSGEWGWLYAKFPTIHSFQHDRFGLMLKAGLFKDANKEGSPH